MMPSSLHGTPCCAWDADERRNLRKTHEMLESTRVPDPSAHYYGETDLDISVYPTAIIEVRPNCMLTRGTQPKMYQAYKGQLSLSLVVNYGNLTVHVDRARHLTCRSKLTSDTFVKVTMTPATGSGDVSGRTACHTGLVYDTNHPVYDEKFTYELLGCDYTRRLHISVFHHNQASATNELIGSMSFSVNNIAKKKQVTQGWFYLLAEKLGRTSHMSVKNDPYTPTLRSRHRRDSAGSATGSTGSSGGDSAGSETGSTGSSGELSSIHGGDVEETRDTEAEKPTVQMVTVPLVSRRQKGYGLTLTSGCPARVLRVEFGSPADICGLQEGDHVMRVNGQSVDSMYAHTVGRVIRHYPRVCVVEVMRCKPGTRTMTNKHIQPVNPGQKDTCRIQKVKPYIQKSPVFRGDLVKVVTLDSNHNHVYGCV